MIFVTPDMTPELVAVVERIEALRAQLKYFLQQQPRRWTGLLRRSTFARAIQASNSIEGYNVTYEDAVAAVENEEPLDEKDEAWMAVVGYRNAMSYILQLADDLYYQHNAGTIRSLHFIMIGHDLSKNPGRWRPGSIYVRREPTGDLVYEGPSVETVPRLMEELFVSLNEKNTIPVVIRAAMAHLNLVMIHPFSDGNGRMGRALQTFVLAREGILDPTFSSIEEYLGANTQEYYAVLAEVGQGAWNPQNDATQWIRFCLTAHYRQAETLLRRNKEMEKLWNIIEQEVLRRGFNDRTILALSDAAYGYKVRNSSYRTLAAISDQVASRDLLALCDAGMLVPKGEKRGRYYIAGDWLREVRQGVRQPKSATDPFTALPADKDQIEMF
jgi:Fic family protein